MVGRGHVHSIIRSHDHAIWTIVSLITRLFWKIILLVRDGVSRLIKSWQMSFRVLVICLPFTRPRWLCFVINMGNCSLGLLSKLAGQRKLRRVRCVLNGMIAVCFLLIRRGIRSLVESKLSIVVAHPRERPLANPHFCLLAQKQTSPAAGASGRPFGFFDLLKQ